MSSAIALLGQPNSGKSTLFNALTGAHQHVGNWPGKTVEKNEGSFDYEGKKIKVIDLPGTYSLAANSDEEIVTRDYIAGQEADTVCILADSSQLERSLFMLADYAGIRVPALLLLNMMDVAKVQGKNIDAKKISKKLGISVIPFVAQDKKNYNEFLSTVSAKQKAYPDYSVLEEEYKKEFGETYADVCRILPENGIGVYSPCWLFAKLVEKDPVAMQLVEDKIGSGKYSELSKILSGIKDGSSRTGSCKFAWIDAILEGSVKDSGSGLFRSKFDRIATSKRWGKPLAIAIMLGALILSIIFGIPFMMLGAYLPGLATPVADALLEAGAHPLLVTILCDGIWTAVGFALAMSGYIFGASIAFGLLEEVGYMARISYVFDNTMRKLGLHGKAVMPFICSFGCNIAGSSGTRVLDTWSQRMTAIALSWVVPCGSTWGVVGLIGSVFFGPGVIVIILLMFAISALHLFITSKVFGKKLLKPSDRTGIIMELPPYHKPRWGALAKHGLIKMKEALKRALIVITLISVVLSLLSYSESGDFTESILGRIGEAIEPVTMFFGLRCQTFIAWIGSMMAKEGALGVLASTFSRDSSVMHALATMKSNPVDNTALVDILKTALTKPEALSFLFAFYFNMPCLMALSATLHETRSKKWTFLVAGYYVVMSLLIAAIVYHVACLIF